MKNNLKFLYGGVAIFCMTAVIAGVNIRFKAMEQEQTRMGKELVHQTALVWQLEAQQEEMCKAVTNLIGLELSRHPNLKHPAPGPQEKL